VYYIDRQKIVLMQYSLYISVSVHCWLRMRSERYAMRYIILFGMIKHIGDLILVVHKSLVF
jgi:hypothetical protein